MTRQGGSSTTSRFEESHDGLANRFRVALAADANARVLEKVRRQSENLLAQQSFAPQVEIIPRVQPRKCFPKTDDAVVLVGRAERARAGGSDTACNFGNRGRSPGDVRVRTHRSTPVPRQVEWPAIDPFLYARFRHILSRRPYVRETASGAPPPNSGLRIGDIVKVGPRSQWMYCRYRHEVQQLRCHRCRPSTVPGNQNGATVQQCNASEPRRSAPTPVHGIDIVFVEDRYVGAVSVEIDP